MSPLQEAFQRQLTALASLPEAQEAGIAQFLPLLLGSVGSMSESSIRAGREMMRVIVEALDKADQVSAEESVNTGAYLAGSV